MRFTSFQPFRTLVAWDRNPWTALGLRLGTVLLLLRPWALQIHRGVLKAEEMDPGFSGPPLPPRRGASAPRMKPS